MSLSASEFPSSIILVSPKEIPSVFTVVQVFSKKFSWLLFLFISPSYLKDIEFYVDSLFFQYLKDFVPIPPWFALFPTRSLQSIFVPVM